MPKLTEENRTRLEAALAGALAPPWYVGTIAGGADPNVVEVYGYDAASNKVVICRGLHRFAVAIVALANAARFFVEPNVAPSEDDPIVDPSGFMGRQPDVKISIIRPDGSEGVATLQKEDAPPTDPRVVALDEANKRFLSAKTNADRDAAQLERKAALAALETKPMETP